MNSHWRRYFILAFIVEHQQYYPREGGPQAIVLGWLCGPLESVMREGAQVRFTAIFVCEGGQVGLNSHV